MRASMADLATSKAPPAPPPPPPPPSVSPREELNSWSAFALRHQLGAMGQAAPDGATHEELAGAYWDALVTLGKHDDEETRRFLRLSSDKPKIEEVVTTWLACVIGSPLPEGPLQPLLRSGELLCRLINCLRPGIVPKVTEYAELMAMHESKRNAKMRENIGQYVDACAELGVQQRNLFRAEDLFQSDTNFHVILRNLEALARHAQDDIPGYVGPLVGKRQKRRHGGALWGTHISPVARVILAGSRGSFMPAVGGRGGM